MQIVGTPISRPAQNIPCTTISAGGAKLQALLRRSTPEKILGNSAHQRPMIPSKTAYALNEFRIFALNTPHR